jgi:SAM-dependent methyltransferase
MQEKTYQDFWNSKDEKRRHELIAGPVPWDISVAMATGHVQMIVTELIKKSVFQNQSLDKVHIAELGCGHGRVLAEFLRGGVKWLVGYDISQEMIAAARKHIDKVRQEEKIPPESVNLELKWLPTTTHIESPTFSVDFFYSFLVFQHMPTRFIVDKSLELMFHSLKEGGIARIQTMRGQPHPEKSFGGFHGHFFPTLAAFQECCEAAGFRTLEAQEDLGHDGWLWLTLERPSEAQKG